MSQNKPAAHLNDSRHIQRPLWGNSAILSLVLWPVSLISISSTNYLGVYEFHPAGKQMVWGMNVKFFKWKYPPAYDHHETSNHLTHLQKSPRKTYSMFHSQRWTHFLLVYVQICKAVFKYFYVILLHTSFLISLMHDIYFAPKSYHNPIKYNAYIEYHQLHAAYTIMCL